MVPCDFSAGEIGALLNFGVHLFASLRACVQPISRQSTIDEELQRLQDTLLQATKYLQDTQYEHARDVGVHAKQNIRDLENALPKIKELYHVSLMNVRASYQQGLEEQGRSEENDIESVPSMTDSGDDNDACDQLSTQVRSRVKSDLRFDMPQWILAEQHFPDNPRSRVLVYDPNKRTVEPALQKDLISKNAVVARIPRFASVLYVYIESQISVQGAYPSRIRVTSEPCKVDGLRWQRTIFLRNLGLGTKINKLSGRIHWLFILRPTANTSAQEQKQGPKLGKSFKAATWPPLASSNQLHSCKEGFGYDDSYVELAGEQP